jgi:multidrug/hemolysin transport system permease protein
VTVNLGALSVAVGDKQNAAKDFYTSPISRAKITGGYMLGSGLAGLIMTLTALILCVAFIAAKGGSLPGLPDCGLLLLTAVLSVLCGNSIVYFVSLFIRSVNAFAAVSTVIGTMIGFLMGVYVPIGALPDTVGWVIKCFPMSHAGSMFKLILADGDIAELFANAPPGALESFRQSMGVTFWYGDFESGFWFSAAVLVVTSAVFYGLSVAVSRKL